MNLMQSNPQLQAMMDANPDLRQVMNDPATMRNAMQMMRNPNAMREAMRHQDIAISQLENHPEVLIHFFLSRFSVVAPHYFSLLLYE